MSYVLMVRVYWCVKEPDSGISTEYMIEEFDGYTYETREDAEKELASAKRINPHLDIWISERSD